MTIDLMKAPFPVTYRELWLPPGINNHAALPASVEGGHGLTLTGARKGTTSDGVHGITGVVTSNVNLTAIHNNENILYIKIRFKLDQPFSVAAGTDQYLFGMYEGPNDYLIGWLEADDGMFHMAHAEGGVVEAIVSVEDTWDIGWHTMLVSLHNANGQRLIIDGGTPVIEAGNTTAITVTADFVLIARDDGVSTEGLVGVEVDIVIGIAALTTDEEHDLISGIPLAAATEEYLLDEGRGVTAVNRGSSGAGANGTLDTSCTWAYGQVQQPVLSLDGINDHGQGAGADISGSFTFIWVAKLKSVYDSLSDHRVFTNFRVAGGEEFLLMYYNVPNAIRWWAIGDGTDADIMVPLSRAIDDYIIMIGTLNQPSGELRLFWDGMLVGSDSGVGALPAAGAGVYIARGSTLYYDNSKPLFVALIDGAFTQKQALAYSRYLKNIFNLPIAI